MSTSQQLETLVEITEILTGPAPFVEKCELILAVLAEFTGSELVTLRELEPETSTLRLVASYNRLIPPEDLQIRLPSDAYLSAKSIPLGSPAVENDYSVLEPRPPGFLAEVNSALSLPVQIDGEIFGTLGFGSRSKGHYPEDTVRVLSTIGAVVGMMIGKAKVQESSRRNNALLEDAPLGIVVVDSAGVIIQTNRHLETLFGYERGELIGNSVETLLPGSLTDTGTSHGAGFFTNPASRPMDEGLRLIGQRKDGREFPVAIGLSSIDTMDGRVTLAHISDDTYRSELEGFLEASGTQLGDLLEAREAEIELIDQVAKIITSTLDIGQVFAKFADGLTTLVEFDLATINVIDREAGSFVAKHFLWADSVETETQMTLPLAGTQTEKAITTGQTIIQDDLKELPGFSTDAFFNDRGLRSTIMTPLIYNDRPIGSMSLASNRPNSFGPRDQRILERLASQIAPAVENARLYEEAVSRTAQLECLLNLAEILGQTSSFPEKVTRLLEQLVQVAEGFSAHFRVPDATGLELVLTASAGAPDGPGFSRPERLGEGSLVFEAYQLGEPLVVHDYQNDPKALPCFAQDGDRSVVFLPIGSGPKPAAVVVVDSNELGHFTPDRVRLLSAIGEGLGALIENATLREQVEAREVEMAVVDEVAKIMTSTLDIDHIYDQFALEIKKLVDFDRATLVEVDLQSNSYTIRNTWGLDVPSLQTGKKMPLEGSFIQESLATGDWVVLEELAPLPDSPVHSHLLKAGLHSHLLAPLVANDEVIGAIALMSRESDAFGPRELAILERLAGQIAPAIENARLYREANDRAQEIQRLNEFTNRILDSNPSALAVLRGSNREVVTVNSSFRAVFRLDDKKVEGQPLSEVLDWVGLEECIRESLSSPSGEGHREMKYPGDGGDARWCSVFAVPLLLDGDKSTEDEALLVISDITEQRHQQERLQEQFRLASVGELASGMAHEINNPLATIHGLSELLQMDGWPAQVTEDARKIQDAAQRAAKVVQNLLSFARKSEPEKRYLNVVSVVDRALELKQHDFIFGNIRVTAQHSQRELPTMVDEHKITQVMLNVLTNAEQAIKARHGRGEITITTSQTEDMIRISVSDDGLGIPPENLGSIFDPFFTTKEVGQGTGLGLSICYGIVRDHGGKMWAESSPGEGSTFHIELPVLPEATPVRANPTINGGGQVTGRRILVVDDEPEVRDILLRALSADGHDVALAPDGESAWKLIQENQFDMIFLDLRMPGIDGQELHQLVSEFSSDLARKIVFITGDTANSDTRKFLDSTPCPVLSKPFTIEAVRSLL